MSGREAPPAWRLPAGVNASLWRYAHTPEMADSEDAYFRGHPLMAADARFLEKRFVEPGRLADLGCGAGRLALNFARRGFEVVGVELSPEMLRVLRAKALAEGLSIGCVRANLCRLTCFADGSFDYAIAMFSTLGMIRGRANRQNAFVEAGRILRPGGRLGLHVHNCWLNARVWEGRAWLVRHWIRWLARRDDAFDRRMLYRGVPEMEVHLYGWRELRRSIERAGLRIEEALPIGAATAEPIPMPGLAHGLRAGGWLVVASKPVESAG